METKKMERAFLVSNLITNYLKGMLSVQEKLQLDEWIAAHGDNKLFFERLTNADILSVLLNDFSSINRRKKSAYKKLRRRLFTKKNLWRYLHQEINGFRRVPTSSDNEARSKVA